MTWLGERDRWFMDAVLPHTAAHHAYARRLLRDRIEADDLVQEAYARLFAIDDWQRLANPHAFTMRTIHNLAMERFRRTRIARIDVSVRVDHLDALESDASPETIAAERSELRRVAAAMEKLPPRCREALQLRRIEGLPPQRVAERMRISVSTVEKHLAKGLRLLVKGLALPDEDMNSRPARPWSRKDKEKKTR